MTCFGNKNKVDIEIIITLPFSTDEKSPEGKIH